jgi:hypothetical protein
MLASIVLLRIQIFPTLDSWILWGYPLGSTLTAITLYQLFNKIAPQAISKTAQPPVPQQQQTLKIGMPPPQELNASRPFHPLLLSLPLPLKPANANTRTPSLK